MSSKARTWTCSLPGRAKCYEERNWDQMPLYKPSVAAGRDELTPREEDVFELIGSGITNGALSEHLRISPIRG